VTPIEIAREAPLRDLRPRHRPAPALVPRHLAFGVPSPLADARSSRRSTSPTSPASHASSRTPASRPSRSRSCTASRTLERAARSRRPCARPLRGCGSRSRARSCPRSASSSAPRRRSRTSTSEVVEPLPRRPGVPLARLGFRGSLHIMCRTAASPSRHGRALSRAAARVRACGRCARAAAFGSASAIGRPDLVRHGRHHGQAVRTRTVSRLSRRSSRSIACTA